MYATLFVPDTNDQHFRARWKIRAQYIALIMVSVGVIPTSLYVAARIASVFMPMAPAPSHSDLVTTVLAGLTISLAVLALMIAGLAIWGYHAIKAEAQKTATTAAKAAALRYVKGAEIQANFAKKAAW